MIDHDWAKRVFKVSDARPNGWIARHDATWGRPPQDSRFLAVVDGEVHVVQWGVNRKAFELERNEALCVFDYWMPMPKAPARPAPARKVAA